MGPNPPISFSRCEKNICLTGLLPSISLEASESTVRKEICEVIHSCSSHDLSNIDPQDFEFISMTGKHAGIPQCKNGFQWNGRAVKELAGAGSIYIRLLKDGANPHSDDDLLPPGPCWGSSNSQASDAVLPNDVLVEQIANDESGSLADCNEDDDNNFVDLVSDEEPDVSGFTTESSSANTVIQIYIGSNVSISANIPANSGGNSVTSTANIPADSDNLVASTANSCNSVTSSANIPANSGGNSVTSTANIPANSGNLVASTANISANSDNLVAGTTTIPANSSNSVAGTANIFPNSGSHAISNNSFITTSSPATMRNYTTSPNNLEDYLPKLQEMFSNMSKEQLQYIYGLCACFDRTIEALLEGPTLEAL